MLQHLHIQNYALIDEIEITFSPHLNIITGETGAGKSIIVGALSLVLGERAELAALGNKDKKCVVEAIFTNNKEAASNFLLENDLDATEEIVVRREVTRSGKSRAFINDTPVNLSQLKLFSGMCVDLHQQFDTLEVGDSDFQREAIDAIAGNNQTLSAYKIAYSQYQKVFRELNKLQQEQSEAAKEFDYKNFLYKELEEAGFSENEIENAESEIKLLNNAEHIKSVISEITFYLEDSETPVINQLKSLNNKFSSLSNIHAEIEVLSQRLQSSLIELQDIAGELQQLNNEISYDAEKIDQLQERISEAYKLLKKHNVTDTASLLQIKESLSASLQQTTDLKELIEVRKNELTQLYDAALHLADKLSENRQAEVKNFESKINLLLSQIGMPNARIVIRITPLPELNEYGKDKVEFLFNANVPISINNSEKFVPVNKVASGGELSRLMLSIKSLIAKSIQLPTLIFDEIDSGISGEAARQAGNIMKSLAEDHQIISITHQPQIASKADHHYFVYKEIKDGKVNTCIKMLDENERVNNIATMLSGKKPSAAAFANAKEMMEN